MYRIIIRKPAKKFIDRLPLNEKRRIVEAIEQLPDSGDIKQRKGHQNKGLFRLRVGEYRIIYSLDDEQLIIYLLDAGNRGEIYRRYS